VKRSPLAGSRGGRALRSPSIGACWRATCPTSTAELRESLGSFSRRRVLFGRAIVEGRGDAERGTAGARSARGGAVATRSASPWADAHARRRPRRRRPPKLATVPRTPRAGGAADQGLEGAARARPAAIHPGGAHRARGSRPELQALTARATVPGLGGRVDPQRLARAGRRRPPTSSYRGARQTYAKYATREPQRPCGHAKTNGRGGRRGRRPTASAGAGMSPTGSGPAGCRRVGRLDGHVSDRQTRRKRETRAARGSSRYRRNYYLVVGYRRDLHHESGSKGFRPDPARGSQAALSRVPQTVADAEKNLRSATRGGSPRCSRKARVV